MNADQIIKELSLQHGLKSVVVVYEDKEGQLKTKSSDQTVGDMCAKLKVLDKLVDYIMFDRPPETPNKPKSSVIIPFR